MAETPSNMLPLGTIAPDFQLQDVISNKMISLKQAKSPIATVIMFICNHCPYVRHILPSLLKTINEYQSKKVTFIAINSNDIDAYPEDGPQKMQALAKELGFTFPYLLDEDQSVAKAYKAACTPDFYLFDANLKCVYRGRFDEATPRNNKPVTGHDLRIALDCVLDNKPVDVEQLPSLGCNIKWKKTVIT